MVGTTGDELLPPPPVAVPAVARPRRKAPFGGDPVKTFALTFLMVALTAGFLAPIVQSMTISVKSPSQLSQADSPLWPAEPQTFEFQGKEYDVYSVPIDGAVRALALYKPGRLASDFIDPANPSAGVIHWA